MLPRDENMKPVALAVAALVAALSIAFPADAQEPIKIGIIATYSGQFADTAQQMDNGVRLYMKQHGDTVAGRKIEIIRRDSGGPNPDVAKRLAQELVVRDKVDILAGFPTSPEALAAADVSAASQKFMVSMNGTASMLTTKSPYVVRTSFTLPQVAQALGVWAATKGGIKRRITLNSTAIRTFSQSEDSTECTLSMRR
jgi:branched-chain amino acid transport system substrate-binding protein